MQPNINALVSQAELLLALQVDGPYVFQLVSRVLHILSAIILVGGLFYLRSVLSPAGVDACFAGRRQIWAKWVGIATAFLLLSGFYNFFLIIGQSKIEGAEPLPKVYHMLFGIKFLLALIVMFVSAILAGKTEAADRFRANMRKWLNIGWLAAMGIIVIAAVMRTLH